MSKASDADVSERDAVKATAYLGGAEGLLDLAESLEAKRDGTREQIDREYRRLLVSILSGPLAITLLWSLQRRTLEMSTSFGLTIILAGTIGIIVQAFTLLRSLSAHRTALARDERALFRAVGILRESARAIAESERWSTLQQAQFRIRLARFDIGRGPDPLE